MSVSQPCKSNNDRKHHSIARCAGTPTWSLWPLRNVGRVRRGNRFRNSCAPVRAPSRLARLTIRSHRGPGTFARPTGARTPPPAGRPSSYHPVNRDGRPRGWIQACAPAASRATGVCVCTEERFLSFEPVFRFFLWTEKAPRATTTAGQWPGHRSCATLWPHPEVLECYRWQARGVGDCLP